MRLQISIFIELIKVIEANINIVNYTYVRIMIVTIRGNKYSLMVGLQKIYKIYLKRISDI